MAKPMKNKERDESKLLKRRSLLIDAALNDGIIDKTGISQATGLKIWEINNVFTANRELFAKFCVRRKTIVDMAADNIYAIVGDRSHPSNYQASKQIVTQYKSDFDEALEAKDSEEISLSIEGGESKSPVTIVFGKRNKQQEEE